MCKKGGARRPGIEPGYPSWQDGILTIILSPNDFFCCVQQVVPTLRIELKTSDLLSRRSTNWAKRALVCVLSIKIFPKPGIEPGSPVWKTSILAIRLLGIIVVLICWRCGDQYIYFSRPLLGVMMSWNVLRINLLINWFKNYNLLTFSHIKN